MTKLLAPLSCIVVLYICTAYAKHAHRVLTFKSNMNEQDIIWKETFVTKIKCVAACLRDQNCRSVHFSPTGSCLGLKIKLEEEDATGGRGQTEHIYVMDRESKLCGPPPTYPNAVIKSTTGEKTVYSCKPEFKCCEKQIIRSCLPTGEWETGKVECIRTTWSGPFGSRKKRFKQDFPCGPSNDIAVVIKGIITGKSMKCYFLRKSDVLFYMAYTSTGYGRSVNTYSAKLNGKWKAKKQMPGIISSGMDVEIKINFFRGFYSLEIENVVRHKLLEAEKGGLPTAFLLQDDIKLSSVKFVKSSWFTI